MQFRVTDQLGEGNVFEYVMAGADNQVQVWDVSDRFNVKARILITVGVHFVFAFPGMNYGNGGV